MTSTPTIQDFGVTHLFDESDQRHYELRCPGCESWQEPQFPDGVDWDRMQVICRVCGVGLDPRGEGRWFPGDPSNEKIRGYQLNRLILPNPPLLPMKLALEGTIPTTQEMFYRQDLGQPFSSPDSRLTPDVLYACIESWSPEAPLKVNVMGIDVGRKLHVVIRGRLNERWYLLEAFTADAFEELEPCFKCYDITICVVDSLPETREARRFQERHPGVVWLARYLNQGIEPSWDHGPRGERVVTAPRTSIIDEMMRRFRHREFVLPDHIREIEDGEYFRQLQAPVRTIELDKWGQPFATYVHRKSDDFAHAEVYATLAAIKANLTGAHMFSIAWGQGGTPELITYGSSEYKER